MSGDFDALDELTRWTLEVKDDARVFPVAFTRQSDGATARMRVRAPSSALFAAEHNLQTRPLPTLLAYVAPAFTPREGDRLELTAPADVAGQVYEVVPPIQPDPFGYSVGLSLVGGSR